MPGLRLPSLALSLVFAAPSLSAALLIQTPGPLSSTDNNRPNSFAIGVMARIDVGAAAVSINQIGTFGQVTSAVSIEYLIFPNVDDSAPLFTSSVDALSPEGAAVWHDSQVFSNFTLNANTTYWIGFALSGPSNSFTITYNSPGSSFSANGLTIVSGINGNVRPSFASPTGDFAPAGGVQPAIRLFGDLASVPEPGTVFTLVPAALAVLLVGRRKMSGRVS